MSSKKTPTKDNKDIVEETPLSDAEIVSKDTDTFLMSLDPGINFTGVSIINTKEGFEVKETFIIKNNRAFTPEEKIVEASQGPRAVKLLAIINKVKSLLEKYNIAMIIIEAPFYNALTPQAYGSLLEVIFGLKYSLLVPLDLKYRLIEPTLVKKLFASHGMAKKEVMKQFLISRIASGDIKMQKPVEELTEHEIDSVAIGFVHWVTTQQPTA